MQKRRLQFMLVTTKTRQWEMAVPISQTTAYAFRDSEHLTNLFALKN